MTAHGVSPTRAMTDQRGAVVLWSLGLVLLLFFAGGLALDLWRVLSYHGTLTGLADKAAVAGATAVDSDALYRNRLELAPRRAEGAAVTFARSQPEWNASSMTVTAVADRASVIVELTGGLKLTLLQMFVPPRGITITVTSRASPTLFQ